jgi:hypothetical protein
MKGDASTRAFYRASLERLVEDVVPRLDAADLVAEAIAIARRFELNPATVIQDILALAGDQQTEGKGGAGRAATMRPSRPFPTPQPL